MGDGECDEPESLGPSRWLPRAAGQPDLRHQLQPAAPRRPVRGNGKIIQELEAVFRGAGWNVIKVIWGSKWDELLAQDKDGALVNKMNTTVDGQFQRYSVESGEFIRYDFFGPRAVAVRDGRQAHRRRAAQPAPRRPRRTRKLYAAYKAATENLGSGVPTVILCKTIKGWTLGAGFEGRKTRPHQIKKMTKDQLVALRDRLFLHDEIPRSTSTPTTRRTTCRRSTPSSTST